MLILKTKVILNYLEKTLKAELVSAKTQIPLYCVVVSGIAGNFVNKSFVN